MKYKAVSIIYIRKRWVIIKKGVERSIKRFSHSDQAYHYAMGISDIVFVHNENGTVKFVTDNTKSK